LYWVAPMDANYRRDEPGKSPMGMDLVPVYEDDQSTTQEVGVITISPDVENNLGVKTVQVTTGNMSKSIDTVGFVKYDEDKLVHIHPRVDGWVEALYVKTEGSRVDKGQPLYSLYSPQLVNAQEEFLIAYKSGNQPLINAAKKRLFALQLSERFINQLEQNQQVSQTVTFYSPQSGVIDGLKIREGFYVKPGNTLMSIAKLDPIWVEAEVFERDAEFVRQNLDVSMIMDYMPEREWSGKVDYIYPTLNQQNRTLRVRLKFANPKHELKPNMFSRVTIHSDLNKASLMVPKEAVIRTGKQDRVVVALGNGKYKSIEVSIGHVGEQYIELLSGVEEGETVVSSAQFLLDSESSKTSDFGRMHHDKKTNSVWMSGIIESVMAEHNMLTISHDEVPEWEWPSMTMDFMVSEDVEMSELVKGQTIHFEVLKKGNDYRVNVVHVRAQPSYSSATVMGIINQIQSNSRVLNISRGPIEKWGREAATMDFVASENIDLTTLSEGQHIKFTFEVREELVVVKIHESYENSPMQEIQSHKGHE